MGLLKKRKSRATRKAEAKALKHKAGVEAKLSAKNERKRDKQAATDALRAGNAPAAAKMYASAAEALGGYADVEMQAEADVLFDLADRAQHDDASRTAKFSEADRHRKSRRRG